MSKMLEVLKGNHIRYGKNSKVFSDDKALLIVSDKEIFLNDLYKNYNKEDRELIIKELGLK